MNTSTVRINQETLETLRKLAQEAGEPMQRVLARAVEVYRRQRILAKANAAYATLRSDPQAWQAEQDERRAWEATLQDGIEE
ncbi:MAG: toxin-antitoxin system protein [Chloroflexi bacterium]|nr:toxin-antitoxin system protein [Chloroflexota bacterium]